MALVSRVGDAASTGPLFTILKEDWKTHHGAWSDAGLQALLAYRIGHWALSRPLLVRLPVMLFYKLFNGLVVRNLYGVEIDVNALIGRKVAIGHHQALQIPAFCIVGDGTLIRHNVNLGFARRDDPPGEVPHLGRDVELGAGCCVLGPVTIGHGARIGPNAVVMTDVPDGATAFAPPARIMTAPAAPPVTRKISVPDQAERAAR